MNKDLHGKQHLRGKSALGAHLMFGLEFAFHLACISIFLLATCPSVLFARAQDGQLGSSTTIWYMLCTEPTTPFMQVYASLSTSLCISVRPRIISIDKQVSNSCTQPTFHCLVRAKEQLIHLPISMYLLLQGLQAAGVVRIKLVEIRR